MQKAIILSAGQGSRLLPLTVERPKCLIRFSGKTLLQWQIEALVANGITDIHIVTGFMTELVEAEVSTIQKANTLSDDVSLTIHFNPFFKVADNLGSCWIVRDTMTSDFLILNGDTLVSRDIVSGLLSTTHYPITVTVDVKSDYDSDDMKVHREGDRLLAIGKTLTADISNAESIGFLAFRGEGISLFKDMVDQVMRTPVGVQHWYLKIIDALADTGKVGTCSIEGKEWAEVDFLNDVEIATALTDRWKARGW